MVDSGQRRFDGASRRGGRGGARAQGSALAFTNLNSTHHFEDTTVGQHVAGGTNMWVGVVFLYRKGADAGSENFIFSWPGYNLMISDGTNRFRCVWRNDVPETKSVYMANGSLIPGKFHTACFVVDGSILKVYADGIDVGTSTPDLGGGYGGGVSNFAVGNVINPTYDAPLIGMAGSSIAFPTPAEVLAWHQACETDYSCATIAGKTQEQWLASSWDESDAWVGEIAGTTLEKSGNPIQERVYGVFA